MEVEFWWLGSRLSGQGTWYGDEIMATIRMRE